MPTNPGLRIGRILGIPIYLHATWVFVFLLFSYSLKLQFAHDYPRWRVEQQWGVGILTTVLFFASVLFHELGHSAVAQHYKIRVVSITLFFFGGLARIGRDPSKAIQEFNIAIAGPLASGVLCAFFLGVATIGKTNESVHALSEWLWKTNGLLALFNLLPGFPLDGGRIFRAIIWGITKDFSRSTRIAGASGRLIAYAMIAIGVWGTFTGNMGQGPWLALLGFFLLYAAHESVAQVTIRETLTGLHAADVMSHEVPTIARDISLEEYGQEVARTGRRCHLALSEDRLVGMMNIHKLNSVPREEWPHTSVQAVMIPRDKILWAAPEEPLLGLLERLLTADVNQMPVVTNADGAGAHIIGMITRDSILRVVRTRAEVGPLTAK